MPSLHQKTPASSRELKREQVRNGAALLSPYSILAGLAILLVCFLAGIMVGPTYINPLRIILEIADRIFPYHWDSGLSDIQSAIIWDIRMPRVVIALLIGSMLSLSGAAYQGVFRNPLADPYLLGVAAGAGFGATLAIVSNLDSSKWLIPIAAFSGGILASFVSYIVGSSGAGKAQNSRLDNTASLILAGVAIASFFTAIQTYLQQRHADTLREVYSWVLGRFSVQGWDEVLLLLPYFVVTSGVILMYRRVLDVFEVGDEEAKSLGIDVQKSRRIILIFASMAASAAVAFAGLIGFVGIVIPHLVRLIFSNSYRVILPLSIIMGAGFLVIADLIARVVLRPAELPIGVVTAFIGTPFFVFILYRARRNL